MGPSPQSEPQAQRVAEEELAQGLRICAKCCKRQMPDVPQCGRMAV